MSIYRHYYSYVLSICLRYSKNREDADELTNSTFLKVFSNLKRYDTTKPFTPWLRKIAVNTALDFIKVSKPRFLHFDELEENFLQDDKHIDYEAEARMDAERLEEHFDKMPEPMRTFFNLYIMDEFTHAEISEQLNCTDRTSKRYLAKARQWIRTVIANENKRCNYEV